jgi:hypothetical protein
MRGKKNAIFAPDRGSQLEKAAAACAVYSQGVYTMTAACKQCGIESGLFHTLLKESPELLKIYKEAKQLSTAIYKADLLPKLQTSLERQINGYYVEESEIVERFNKIGDPAGKTITTKRKYVNPSTTAVIFGLKNVDPSQWNLEGGTQAETQEEQVFQIGEQIIKFQ